YQENAFIGKAGNTKLFSIQKLIHLIGWKGRVNAFGDHKYDLEYLRFYDGTLITNNSDKQSFLKRSPIIT
ncbi:MAG TPA: hypothetical protein VFJ43_11480, partial [Bacteroidia bacterium]|nr:hypothetical protein [Bacteroidia bacterium]